MKEKRKNAINIKSYMFTIPMSKQKERKKKRLQKEGKKGIKCTEDLAKDLTPFHSVGLRQVGLVDPFHTHTHTTYMYFPSPCKMGYCTNI